MDINKLVAIVSILITLSIASERLVEIIKGFFPSLNREILDDPKNEAWRKAKISILAVLSGIVTAGLSISLLKAPLKDFSGLDLTDKSQLAFAIIALGLLASGGSAFWNSILEYLLKIKDLKKVEVAKAEALKNAEVERVTALNAIEIGRANELKSLEVGKTKEALALSLSLNNK